MNEQDEMERWRRRMEFWRRSVLLDGVCPTLGVIGLVWLVATGSDSLPAYGACCGAIGLPGVGALAEILSRRPPPR